MFFCETLDLVIEVLSGLRLYVVIWLQCALWLENKATRETGVSLASMRVYWQYQEGKLASLLLYLLEQTNSLGFP